MFAIAMVHAPLMLFSLLQLSGPPADCALDVMPPHALEQRAHAQFTASIEQYVALHRRLERTVAPEQLFSDPEDMFAAREALASALRDARPLARQGVIFTPGVADLLVSRLAAAIRQHGYDPRDILAAVNADRLPGMPDPEVNGEFPWGVGSAMWPALLQALPSLPPELQYRFWGRDLVLVDVHANLVLDLLADALPPAEAPAEPTFRGPTRRPDETW